MPSREQYIAQRVGARVQSRGEGMVLRRTTVERGRPVPYRNPPDVSADLTVTTGVTSNGQAYLGIAGSSVIGRLVAGDQILTWPNGGLVPIIWTVGITPSTLLTDSSGIIVLDGSHVPVVGTPLVYSPDALAADDHWNAIAVSTQTTSRTPASVVGLTATFVFAADQHVYGSVMQAQAMVALGWTEVDTIGVRLAAYNAGAIAPPKVDDQMIVNGQLRSVLSVGSTFSNGINWIYLVQLR